MQSDHGSHSTVARQVPTPTADVGRRSLPSALMQLRTTRRDVAGHLVLALDGAADMAALPQLHDACQRLVTGVPAGSSLAIDLDGTTIVDDAALGLILGAAATARSHGATLRVVCAGERLRGRLAATRFDRAVDVVRSLADVVRESPPAIPS